VRYRTYTTQADAAAFCDVAENIARTTYQRGLGVGFIDNAEHRRRVALAAEKGWLKAYAAFVGEEPVAFWCGRLYNHAMYLDWTGYKPDYRKYELGTVLFLRMVEDICASGATEMNYGGGASFYKERFGDQNLHEESVGIYSPTFKGVAVGFLKSIEAIANRTAKAAVTRLGIVDRLKKRWRGRLAKSAGKEPAHSEDSGPEGA
jgi:CelD/BcsL family acetyltransferase involved in cellulose biosynthesis